MPLWKFPSDAILSVTSYTQELKCLMEKGVPPCWIRGEISNLKHQSSGHIYFTLKDAGSQVAAVLFRADAIRQSTPLVEGKEILVYGQVQVYEPRGTYQLIARCILPSGDGRLRIEFERQKALLQSEGLFDADRKKPLPFYPKCIAIITSPTGAVLQDFNQILLRGQWRGTVILCPASIQGPSAMGEILAQLKQAERLEAVEAIVLARGGGSLEDLWVFNETMIVRALAACKKPTLTAIGHETDTTLVDYASDRRFETPSAAAHWVLNQSKSVEERKGALEVQWHRAFGQQLEEKKRLWASFAQHWRLLSPRAAIESQMLRVGEVGDRLNQSLRRAMEVKHGAVIHLGQRMPFRQVLSTIQQRKQRLNQSQSGMEQALKMSFKAHHERLLRSRIQLSNHRLENILGKGFSYISDEQGTPCASAQALRVGQRVQLHLRDGVRKAEVL
jgi:exodeoxyribonuclease VII large subunit